MPGAGAHARLGLVDSLEAEDVALDLDEAVELDPSLSVAVDASRRVRKPEQRLRLVPERVAERVADDARLLSGDDRRSVLGILAATGLDHDLLDALGGEIAQEQGHGRRSSPALLLRGHGEVDDG